jgi:hypothetical protein
VADELVLYGLVCEDEECCRAERRESELERCRRVQFESILKKLAGMTMVEKKTISI